MEKPIPKPKSRYVTYVTERDNIDHEHMGLFRALHEAQINARDASALERNFSHLKMFGDLLRAHHASEKAFLDIVDPEHALLHIGSHRELERQFEVLVEQSRAVGRIDEGAVSKLIQFLVTHVKTLDVQLQEAVDKGHLRIV